MTLLRLDTTHSPAGLWLLDGDLTDSSGNGNTLTVQTGTIRYSDMFPGVRGGSFDGSTDLILNTTPSGLKILGDVTLQVVCLLRSMSFTTQYLFCSCGVAGSGSAQNYLYQMGLLPNSSQGTYMFWETGSGTGVIYGLSTRMPPVGQPFHLAVTRTSNVVQFYLNGNAWGPASSALTGPTDGSSALFRIGGETGFNVPDAILTSVKVVSGSLTASQIKAEYGRSVGPFYSKYAP